MPSRKFTEAMLAQAAELRGKGEKWIVIEAMLGEGIKGACDYRRTRTSTPRFCNCNQGRLPCECKPDGWLVKTSDGARTALTEQEANALLTEMPGATKHALFMRG